MVDIVDYSLMEKKVEEVIVLDLGCGQRKIDVAFCQTNMNVQATRVVGVDFVKVDEDSVIHDLNVYPWPFADSSIDAIHSSHFLEHLDGFERIRFFEECYRVLKPGGKMRMVHPYYKSVRAIQDPTHKWPPIAENSYLYWNKEWRELNLLTHGHYDMKCDFDFQVFYTWQDPSMALKHEEARSFAIDKYWNCVADMCVDMTKK